MASAKKLPSGNWRVQLFIGTDEHGKRKYKSFTAETKKEAEFLAAQYNQLHIEVNRSERTLREATERYIKSKENILSPSTVRGYYVALRNYVQRLFATKIKDISPEVIQIAFNDFAKDYSAKTCRNAHGLITAVLKTERPDLHINTTLPRLQKRSIYVPNDDEITSICEMLSGKSLQVAFLLACQCGLRASEIAALKTSSVFPNHIEIKKARVPCEGGGDVIKEPKSTAGYREVPISEDFYKYLIAHADAEGFVHHQRGSNISNSWGEFRSSKGLDKNFNFHALRHYYASSCLLLGIPQKYIAELMGHNSLDMIEKVYQHVFPSAMAGFANLLRNKNSELMQHEIQHEKL